MRILILTPEFPPQFGGIGTHCFEMAKHWSRQAEVTVLAPAVPPGQTRAETRFEIVELRPTRSRLIRLLRSERATTRLMSRGGFDIVYVAHWRTCGVAFRLAAARSGSSTRYIQAIHGGEVLYLLRRRERVLLRRLFRWTIGRADRLIALGEYQADLLEQLGVGRDRVFVSPEGVDVSSFQRPATEEVVSGLRRRHRLEGKRILLTVARLAPHKGHDTVIRALPEILLRVPDAAYLIVGDGSGSEHLRRLADQVGVADHVHFAGFVPDHELAGYYHLCDLFVMPSKELNGDTEGFGIVFLEAAACGKAAIGGRTGGVVEAVQDGRTGLLVEPDSTAEIADAAVRLLTDVELAQRMGEAGRRRVAESMQYQDIAANILGACCVGPATPRSVA
jgi:phosphatidylinositol alpha-1,6-mannosyltransferase